MDISKGSIYELLNGKYQFVVPVYQRKYSWLKDVQCDRLWKDIVNMEKQSKRHHFVGSIVTISDVNVPMGIVGSALDALPHCCGRFPKACPRTVLTRLHVHGSPLHHNLVIMYMRITVRTHCQRFSVHLQHSLFPFCVFR